MTGVADHAVGSTGPVVRHRLPDGRRLEVTDAGSGPVAVVFESGMGGGLASWGTVAPLVAPHARTVTYSRSGFGSSDPDPRPRDVARAAADLVDLLDVLGIDRAVLVGHSYGGPIIRQVAADAPGRVAGLVLVDATDEGCELFFCADLRRASAAFATVAPLLGATGLGRSVVKRLAAAAPPDVQRRVVAESGSSQGFRTWAREVATATADLERLRDDPLPRVTVPLTVITAGRPERGRTATARRACLLQAHARRAAAHPDGRHVVADRAGHHIPFDDPRLVADEIGTLLVTLADQGRRDTRVG